MVENFKNNLYLLLGLFLFISIQNNIYADSNICNYQNNNLDLEIRKYKIRINGFMEKNKDTTCDILYGYNKILNNEDLMNKFEDNPLDFQQFSEFIRDYPKLSQFINTYEEFKNFNKISSKDIIEKTLTKVNLGNDKKSNLAFLMALSFQSLNFNGKILENDLNDINKYSEKDMEFVVPFWNAYINFYSESGNMMKYKEFSAIINEITIPTLKEYTHRQEFYTYFLSDKNNLEYTKTIKLLLDKKEIKEKYLLSFIRQISFDIENAIEKGTKAKDIVLYLNPFISDRILMESFYKGSCNGSDKRDEGIESAIISQSLSEKISFKKDNDEIFSEITRFLKNEPKESEKIIMLSYYNLMLRIYNELENKEQKDVLLDLFRNLTNDKIFNMRAITILYQYTDYFADIVNKNWKNEEYRAIFYIQQSGESPLKYLKDTNSETMPKSIKNLNEMVYTLIRTPKENLNDLTLTEIGNNTLEIVDTASIVTLIIPGVGIGVNLAKELAKQSVKTIIKQGLKRLGEKSYKVLKNSVNEYFEDRIKYGDGRRKLSKNINNFLTNANKVENAKDIVIITTIIYRIYNYYFEEKNQKLICGEEN